MYRLLVENSLDLISLLSPSGRILYASPSHEKVLGYPVHEMSGKLALEFVHPDDVELARKALVQSLKTGYVWLEALRFRHKDGHVVVLEGKGTVIYDETGAARSVIASSRDITARVQAEEERARLYRAEHEARAAAELARERLSELQKLTDAALAQISLDNLLRETLSRVQQMLQADATSVFLFDEDSHRLFVRASIGLEEESESGFSLAPGEGFAGHIAVERRAMIVNDISTFPVVSPLLLEWGVRALMGAPLLLDGRLIGVLRVACLSERCFTDADLALLEIVADRVALAIDRAEAYESAQAARARAERIAQDLRKANEVKDEFLGMVSHELRTPLTSIYGGIRLLSTRFRDADREFQELLSDMERDSERLRRMLEDLMALARAELGQEIVTEPVLLHRIIEREVLLLQKHRPGRVVYVEAPKRVPAVAADAGYTAQVIRNLLSNAEKYSPPESPVEVSARVDEREVTVSVADRGAGISAEETELIFQRFYRSGKTASSAGGVGIGLAVCKRLVEMQSGRIWAELRESGGLRVSFTVPLLKEE